MTHQIAIPPLTLVSHALCPYVQRAAIVALEKAIPLQRVVIDLAQKPDWFLERSPTGKVPMLLAGDTALFESAPIAEFLDEISGGGMLPTNPVERAHHRAWIEFASGTLSDIGAFYGARSQADADARADVLKQRLIRLSGQIEGPWFGGASFGLVDAAFAPVFRYLDLFERKAGLFLAPNSSALANWRERLSLRASVRAAVAPDYPRLLANFLIARQSYLGQLIGAAEEPAERA